MHSRLNWENLPDTALLRERQLLTLLPFSHATMWRMVKNGTFPPPIKIGQKMTAWPWGSVRTWLANQNVRVKK